jgi:hypothetical protein
MGGLVFKFPTNVEMDAITQEYRPDPSRFIGETILPAKPKKVQRVEWFERHNVKGKTSVHTMDTDAKISGRRGETLKSYEPIPHKEAELVKESEILKARDLATLGGVISMDELVMDSFRTAMIKDDVAMEVERWAALQGELDINENGVVIHETFPIQEYTPQTEWDDLANATVLKDLNAIKLMFRATGATAQGAKLYLNATSFNVILENKNPDDLRGFNVDNFRSAAFDIDQFNKLLTARALPNFQIYDEGWIDDDGNFQTFIPDGIGILVGKRQAGETVGDYAMTPTLHRSVNGQAAPGRFAFVTVNGQQSQLGQTGVSLAQLGGSSNPRFEVVHGVYGGPRLLYARSVVKINAFAAA